eukprot:jgi/Chlat1/5141/Chrsp33S05138
MAVAIAPYDILKELTEEQRQVFADFRRLVDSGRLGDGEVASEGGGEGEESNAGVDATDAQVEKRKRSLKDRLTGRNKSGASEKTPPYILSDRDKEYCDDICLVRYLRARDFKLKKASQALRGTLQWRVAEQIDKLSARTGFINSCLALGKMYLHGTDKNGHPAIMTGVHVQLDPHSSRERLLFMIYQLEMAIKAMDTSKGIHKMTWVSSLAGYNSKYNGDVRFTLDLLNCLQSHYVERLARCYLVDAPFVFRTAWKAVYPFIDEQTKKKIIFVEPSKTREVLAEYFDMKELEKERFNGDNPYVYHHESYVEATVALEERDPKADPIEKFDPLEAFRKWQLSHSMQSVALEPQVALNSA